MSFDKNICCKNILVVIIELYLSIENWDVNPANADTKYA